jgi:hypothetical protein
MRLPVYIRSAELLELLQKEWLDQHPDVSVSPPPSYVTMMRIWRADFSHVKVPRNTEYGTCSDCFDLAARLRECRSEDDKQQWDRDKNTHHTLHKVERREMMKRCAAVEADQRVANVANVDGTMPTSLPAPKPRISAHFFLSLLIVLTR